MATTARTFAASVVGWIVVLIILFFVGGAILGALRWAVRLIAFLVVIGALIWLYFRLRRGA